MFIPIKADVPAGTRSNHIVKSAHEGHFGRRIGALLLSGALLTGTIGLMSGCRKRGFGADAEGKVKVVATIFPMYDFVRRIGGDQVAVNMMVPAGTEPHAWEPSTRDMMDLEEADLLVYNGAGMETWMDDVLSSVQNKDLVVLEASKDVSLLKTDHDEDEDEDHEDHDDDHHHGEYDPHVWLSPSNAKIEMRAIADALKSIDPEHADMYEQNYKVAAEECDKLSEEYASALAPYEGRYIVVAHEAYGYLCHEYGLNQIGIEGVSADQEPDAARMREIIDMVGEYDIRCIFFEELVDPKVAKTIADETGCKTAALSPLDGLTEEDIDNGRNYYSVMRDNLATILQAFE